VAETPARRTGLGRGLQALLPNAGDQPHAPDPGDGLAALDDGESPRLSALVESGLDVLQRAVGVDVCAYVHSREQGRPRLWLRSGPGAALRAAEWVELGMEAVGAVLGQVRVPRTLTLGRTELLAVPTRDRSSSGVHLLGRTGRALTDHERTVAIHLVQAFGEALHGLLPEQDGDPLAPVAPAGAVVAVGAPARVGADVAGGAAVIDLIDQAPVAAVEVIDLIDRSPPVPVAVTARWPAPIDLEELVRDAVRASGVRHTELNVRLLADGGTDVIDVAAGHRGDRVRVVLPADPDDPADAANRAALQTVNLLQLIGAGAAHPEHRAAG
jgi:hypothetical protein